MYIARRNAAFEEFEELTPTRPNITPPKTAISQVMSSHIIEENSEYYKILLI